MGLQNTLLTVAMIGFVLAVGAAAVLQFKPYPPHAAKISLVAGLVLGLSLIGGFLAVSLA